jgi:hypothetical protein
MKRRPGSKYSESNCGGGAPLAELGRSRSNDVGSVNTGQRAEGRLRGAGRAVMKGDGFDHRHGQTPQTDQIPADISVIGAKNLVFGQGSSNPSCARRVASV